MHMNEPNEQELQRILSLVADGTITPEEGDRLVESLEKRKDSIRCPFCAERIAAGLEQCPECASILRVPPPPHSPPFQQTGGGVPAMGGLGKFLLLYTFVVTSIVILTELRALYVPASACRIALAGLGFTAAFLISKGNPAGWTLGAWWGGLQAPLIILGHAVINKQLFTLSLKGSMNGFGLGMNLVGIILLIFFLKAKRAAAYSQSFAGPDRYTREVHHAST